MTTTPDPQFTERLACLNRRLFVVETRAQVNEVSESRVRELMSQSLTFQIQMRRAVIEEARIAASRIVAMSVQNFR